MHSATLHTITQPFIQVISHHRPHQDGKGHRHMTLGRSTMQLATSCLMVVAPSQQRVSTLLLAQTFTLMMMITRPRPELDPRSSALRVAAREATIKSQSPKRKAEDDSTMMSLHEHTETDHQSPLHTAAADKNLTRVHQSRGTPYPPGYFCFVHQIWKLQAPPNKHPYTSNPNS